MQGESDKRQEIRSRIYHQIDTFQKICRDNSSSPDKIVHELRKSIKRIRALFRFLKPFISESDFHLIDGKLAKTGRSLTQEREATVNIVTFTELTRSMGNEFSEQSRRLIVHGLVKVRNQSFSHWQNGLNKTVAVHQFTMSRIHDEIKNLKISENQHDLELKAIENSQIRSIRYYNDARLSRQTEIIHKWRKQLKRLFFQLKFGLPDQSPEVIAMIKLLDKITDLLGKDHDLALLIHTIKGSYKKDLSKDEFEYLVMQVDRERTKIQGTAFRMGKELTTLTMAELSTELVTV